MTTTILAALALASTALPLQLQVDLATCRAALLEAPDGPAGPVERHIAANRLPQERADELRTTCIAYWTGVGDHPELRRRVAEGRR